MKKNPCDQCSVQAECAANDWCLFDSNNKKCPNHKEGMKQYKLFLEDYFGVKHD